MKTYKDIIASYDEYLTRQTEKYYSSESRHPHWVNGQIRYITEEFATIQKSAHILDIACGDGVGLSCFKQLGFAFVEGAEIADAKIEIAKLIGYPVHRLDMHKLDKLSDSSFDVVYSSHSLEHAYDPPRVLSEFHRILKPEGLLKVVLPYPDVNAPDDAHGGRYELGTNIPDDAQTTIIFFSKNGFELKSKKFDSFREPEVWLNFTRI